MGATTFLEESEQYNHSIHIYAYLTVRRNFTNFIKEQKRFKGETNKGKYFSMKCILKNYPWFVKIFSYVECCLNSTEKSCINSDVYDFRD